MGTSGLLDESVDSCHYCHSSICASFLRSLVRVRKWSRSLHQTTHALVVGYVACADHFKLWGRNLREKGGPFIHFAGNGSLTGNGLTSRVRWDTLFDMQLSNAFGVFSFTRELPPCDRWDFTRFSKCRMQQT